MRDEDPVYLFLKKLKQFLPIIKKNNPLESDFKVLKSCCDKYDYEEKCECLCVFHLEEKSQTKGKEGACGVKADLGLFMKVNNMDLQ